jgi:hypothetical protein
MPSGAEPGGGALTGFSIIDDGAQPYAKKSERSGPVSGVTIRLWSYFAAGQA